MNILGMFGPGENPSAALIMNGKLVALIEEERLNRIKMSPNHLPINAAKLCLKIGGININNVNEIAWGWDCEKYEKYLKNENKKIKNKKNFNYLQNELNKNLYNSARIRRAVKIGFSDQLKKKMPKIHFLNHHLCHAASAFFCSGFKESNILTIDGSGEDLTTLLCEAKGNKIKIINKFKIPNSLGGYYATFTEFLGFKPYMDEGKFMGLAAYGKYSKKIQSKLDKFLKYNKSNGFYEVNNKLRYDGKHTFGERFTDEFVKIFGKKRQENISALTKPYPDIAFNVQHRLENIVKLLAKNLYKKNNLQNLCLAGGVAMNCKMNGELSKEKYIKNIFVQPAASDNGVSLGAAQILSLKKGIKLNTNLKNVYYGPKYSNSEILGYLKESKVNYVKLKNTYKDTAKLIYENKIICWFQGRMEYGARSLGNRSIIASPLYKDMRDKINMNVKHRENWRPFCPSVIDEDYNRYIDSKIKSYFMTIALPINKKIKDKIPSCVHIDDTVRVQMVDKKNNYRYWKLIKEFKKLSGHGIVINTSFNIQGEPIVCSPRDALRTFGGTGLDALIIGDYLVTK
jgi:carbamoyltransferase